MTGRLVQLLQADDDSHLTGST